MDNKKKHYEKLSPCLYIITHGFMEYPSENCFIGIEHKRKSYDKTHYKNIFRIIRLVNQKK